MPGTVTPTITYPNEAEYDRSVILVTWLLTTANPQGIGWAAPEWADKTWDIDGTSAGLAWGAATAAIQGANTGTATAPLNQQTLNNAAGGTALSTAGVNKVWASIENPLFVFPTLTTPGVGATVRVALLCRRATPLRQ